jgi:type III pantothenate kinase
MSLVLAIDVGNSTTAFGWFRDGTLCAEQQLSSALNRSRDELKILLTLLFEQHFGTLPIPDRIALCSVVPGLTGTLVSLTQELWSKEPLVVGPGVKTGMPIRIQEPGALGADRVVVALAARALCGAPCVAVDFGTALSFDIVGADGAYEGSVIAPGPQLAADALADNTAKLPRIDLVTPRSVIGKSTVSAMQAGTMLGFAALIDGIISLIESEVGQLKAVVATGADAERFADISRRISSVEPALALRGLALISDRDQEAITEHRTARPRGKRS